MIRTFAIAAILALGITAVHADEVSTRVSFGDLDLSQPADAKILADRLQAAAQAVCVKANPETILPASMKYCIDMSVSIAMDGVESSLDQAVQAKLVNVRTAMETP